MVALCWSLNYAVGNEKGPLVLSPRLSTVQVKDGVECPCIKNPLSVLTTLIL